MNVRVRPVYRYVPRRRGFLGLGDDGDGTDSTGTAYSNVPSADNPFTNPFGTTTTPSSTPSSTDGSGAGTAYSNLPSADNPFTNPFSTSTTSASRTSTPASSPSSPTQNWAAVLNSAVTSAGKIIQQDTNPMFSLGPGTYAAQTASGLVVSTAGIPATNPLAALTSSSMTPLLLLGGAALLLFMVVGKK